MAFAVFLVEAVIVSLSGVMAPGPINAATVGSGTRSPHAGALVAFGHGIVEFPLMLFIFFGLGHVLGLEYVKTAIFLLGGGFLLFMGGDMLRNLKHAEAGTSGSADAPLVAGILLSMGNAYFLVWWATVGAALIVSASEFGAAGVAAFGFAHWLCDFAWLFLISWVVYKSRRLWTSKVNRVVFGLCSAILGGFGVWFIVSGITLAVSA